MELDTSEDYRAARLFYGEPLHEDCAGVRPFLDSVRDTQHDDAKAVDWYLKAAEQGDANAQLFLGLSCDLGRGVPQDRAMALVWYRKASTRGCAQAQFILGLGYAFGHGLPLDHVQAAKWYLEAAKQGHPKAQSKLGACYLLGEGVHRDEAKAIRWYQNAAEQGEVEARLQLGHCYLYGHGVPQDYHTAILWYRAAAEHEPDSLLPDAYDRSFWCNYSEVFTWYQNVAGQGHAKARSLLGLSYNLGQDVYQDYPEAVKQCLKAAEQGFAPAQFRLGCIYDIWQEASEAVSWYRRAAEQGLPEAQRNLGACYYHGHGIPQDYSEAFLWLSLAVANGETDASELRDEVAREKPYPK